MNKFLTLLALGLAFVSQASFAQDDVQELQAQIAKISAQKQLIEVKYAAACKSECKADTLCAKECLLEKCAGDDEFLGLQIEMQIPVQSLAALKEREEKVRKQ